MAKYLLIAAVVISLVTAGLGYKNYVTLTETRTSLVGTEDTLRKTADNLKSTKAELAATTTTLTTATADKEKLTADVAAAQSELSTTKASLATATAAVTEKEALVASTQAAFDAYKVEHPESTDPNIPKVAGEIDPRIPELEALVASQNEKIKNAETQLATLRKRDEERQKGLVRLGLEGRVLAVNPAWNFVVLSIGDKQGVVNNAEFLLKRGGQYLGKVRITSVEPSTSIADIVANTLPAGVAVQPGDSVIYQQATEN